MRFGLCIFFFFVPASFSLAQPVDWARVHTLTVNGIDQLYDLQIDSARSTFDEVIRIAPDDPRGWFFKSMAEFYLYQLTKQRKAFDDFFALSDKVIDKAESILDRSPDDANAKFYLGGIYGYRGLAHQRDGSILSAVWDGRKGYGLLKEAATGPQHLTDARMGFGLFTYLLARIPSAYSWILDLLGYRGDLKEGLAHLKVAADSGIYTRTEAAFFYAQFSFFEGHNDEADTYLRRLIEQYPSNPLFVTTYATWELRRDRIDSAIIYGEKAVALNARYGITTGDEFAHSTLAAAYYAANDFRRAIGEWEQHIATTENTENISNYVYYRLGIAYEILGDRTKALAAWMRMAKNTDPERPWESVSWRRSRPFVRAPLTAADITIAVAGNVAQSGRQSEAAEMFRIAVHQSGADPERHAVALTMLAVTLLNCGQSAEVIRIADEVVHLQAKEETWTVPHALFYAGTAYAQLGRTEEALRSFEQAMQFDDYDWDVSLKLRIERSARDLKAKVTQ